MAEPDAQDIHTLRDLVEIVVSDEDFTVPGSTSPTQILTLIALLLEGAALHPDVATGTWLHDED